MSVRIILLCEDQQLLCFLSRFLKRRGWGSRDIHGMNAPPGVGSAEQWVRETYPGILQALRSKGSSVVLLVGTDADTLSVVDRIAILDQACRNKNIPSRLAQDPVIMVVPKRNIETWLAYLRGESVNEVDNYPRYRGESDCRKDVKALDDMCRKQQLRQPAPPSLQATCGEYRKMPARLK
ncbi:MAG: hypothetical protein HQL82_00315 [Magnetococcales bacterium]|nr:hypothetical protein [Magnetococcales bacterium]